MSPRSLSLVLRVLARTQRRRLGRHAGAVLRAALLDVSEAEAEAEAAIDSLRIDLARDDRRLDVVDHGAGTRGFVVGERKPASRRVADIYHRAAATPAWGRFLFRLVRELRPRRVLELGTSLGISAAHIGSALELNDREGLGAGRMVSLEGDPGLAEQARRNVARLGLEGCVDVVTGRFADLLPRMPDTYGPFDLAFVDGHHEAEATRTYWRLVRTGLTEGACVAFDDIEPGRQVRHAWARIVAEERLRGACVADLIGLGLLFLPDIGAPREVAKSDLHAAAVGQ